MDCVFKYVLPAKMANAKMFQLLDKARECLHFVLNFPSISNFTSLLQYQRIFIFCGQWLSWLYNWFGLWLQVS